MDLTQAAQRILRRHWLVILLMLAVGVAIPIQLHRMSEPTFQAGARFTLGTEDTRDGQEASALADTAQALGTSPQTVTHVLSETGLYRDPALLVQEIHVAPIGSSGVLELTVTDSGRYASATLANALVTEIVRQRDEAGFASSRQLLSSLEGQLAELDRQIADVQAQAAAAVARLQSVDALALHHDELVTQRARLLDQHQALVQTLATAIPPRVVDASTHTGTPVPTGLHVRIAIGVLLGLVLGVAVAATLESWRPTLSGPAIARHLGAPLLARLPKPPRAGRVVGSPWLVNYLILAADAAGVEAVQLAPVGPPVDVSGLAEELSVEGGPDVFALPLGPEWAGEVRRAPQRRTGLVAVTPDVVKGTGPFQELERHAELAHQPIIGVLTYRGRLRAADRRSAVPHRATLAAEPGGATPAGSAVPTSPR